MAKWFLLFVFFWPTFFWGQCGSCQNQVQLVNNGQFSNGNVGFTSEMNYVTGIFTCPLCPENTYTIGTNAVFHHSGFTGTDHTNPPAGSFFIANGMGALGSTVWCQNIAVIPQTDYTFSFWTRDVTNNTNEHPMAILYAAFNGIWSSDSIVAAGGWTQFSSVWNSGEQTTLELCIINNQWQTGGNDFGVDDLSLTACHPIVLSQQAFAGSDATICSGETVSLGQGELADYNYTWIPDLWLNDPSSGNPIWSGINTSQMVDTLQYVVISDSANVGCITTDTMQLVVRNVPELLMLADTVVCPGEFAFYTISDLWQEVYWNGMAGASAFMVPTGQHQLEAVYNQCHVSESFIVGVVEFPDLNLPPSYQVCAPDGLLLDFDVAVDWSDGTYSTNWVTYASDTIAWSYDLDGCTFLDSTIVEIFPVPNWIFESDTVICNGQVLNLDPQIPGDWNLPGQQSALVTDQPGDMVFTAISGNCEYFFPIEVLAMNSPALPEDEIVEYCPDVKLTIGIENEDDWDFYWDIEHQSSQLDVNTEGIYVLTASNQCGTDSMRFEVQEIVCSSAMYIPGAFTPNDDGVNEFWRPVGENITGYHLVIYDQLGQAIFETRDMNQGWNPGIGRVDNAYSFRLNFINYDGQKQSTTGHFLLLR